MAKKAKKKITTVRSHPMKVPVSKKNPTGVTVRDQHTRRLKGTYLDAEEIAATYKNYDRKKLTYPAAGKLKQYKGLEDKFDDIIAVWTDYFNKKFNSIPPMDPDTVKALIASESSFQEDPPGNRIALGVIQITKATLKILQDPKGEAKDFIFKNIRQKDLKDPNICIPLGIRWLNRKKVIAKSKLGREPTHEEIILEYKGMLKSDTDLKRKALENYRNHYGQLKR